MEPENIPLRVAVIFSSGGKVEPKWFELNRRKYEIKEVSFFWKDQVGKVSFQHFSVTDGIVDPGFRTIV